MLVGARRFLSRTRVIRNDRRRTALARGAGLRTRARYPVLVREVADEAALAMALIENIQREDLNPLEEAAGISASGEGIQHDSPERGRRRGPLAKRTTNLLRLAASWPKPVQDDDSWRSTLEMGHARALLSLDGAHQLLEAANRVAVRGLSVS